MSEGLAVDLALTAVALLVLVPALRWLGDRISLGSRRERHDLGRAVGLQPVPGGPGAAYEGLRAGRRARAWLGWEGGGRASHPVTDLHVAANIELPEGLLVMLEAERGLLGGPTGPDLQLRDPGLDAALWVSCPNPAAALRLLRPPGLGPAVLRALRRLPGASLRGGGLHLQLLGHAGPGAIGALLDALAGALTEIEGGAPAGPAAEGEPAARVAQFRAARSRWGAAGLALSLVGLRLLWLGLAEGGPAPRLAMLGFGLALGGVAIALLGPRCPACGASPGRSPATGIRAGAAVRWCLSCGARLR